MLWLKRRQKKAKKAVKRAVGPAKAEAGLRHLGKKAERRKQLLEFRHSLLHQVKVRGRPIPPAGEVANALISVQLRKPQHPQAFMMDAFDAMHKNLVARLNLRRKEDYREAVVAANALELTHFVNRILVENWRKGKQGRKIISGKKPLPAGARLKRGKSIRFDEVVLKRIVEGYESALEHLGQNRRVETLIRQCKEALAKMGRRPHGKQGVGVLFNLPEIDTVYFKRALKKSLGTNEAFFNSGKREFESVLTSHLEQQGERRLRALAKLFP